MATRRRRPRSTHHRPRRGRRGRFRCRGSEAGRHRARSERGRRRWLRYRPTGRARRHQARRRVRHDITQNLVAARRMRRSRAITSNSRSIEHDAVLAWAASTARPTPTTTSRRAAIATRSIDPTDRESATWRNLTVDARPGDERGSAAVVVDMPRIYLFRGASTTDALASATSSTTSVADAWCPGAACSTCRTNLRGSAREAIAHPAALRRVDGHVRCRRWPVGPRERYRASRRLRVAERSSLTFRAAHGPTARRCRCNAAAARSA